MAVGVDSSVVGEGEVVVDRESISVSLSISLSFSLDDVLDRSILGNVLGSIDTVRDSCVVSWAVVVGHSVASHLGLGINDRVDSSSVVGDSWCESSLVGNSWSGNGLVSNSWSCNSMAVDAGEGVVGIESAE